MSPKTAEPIRVLIVDDEEALRTLIRYRLERTGGYAVAAEATGTAEATRLAAAEQPDVILLDLLLGAEHGSGAIGALMRAAPQAMIAALTVLPAEDQEGRVKGAGAFAFYEKTMLKRLPDYVREDLAVFRRALSGEDVVAPAATSRRTDGRRAPARGTEHTEAGQA